MTLPGTIRNAPAAVRGFDANVTLSASAARQFVAAGYRFCVRYVGRTQMASHDLTAAEARDILGAGLALMTVQHVQAGEWMPSGALGTQYGANAAKFSAAVGLPAGVNVWLDLESVSRQAAAADVIAYCNSWFDQVAAAGFAPGIYVGWQPMLSNAQLRDNLKFKHYWGAYNVDAVIPQRGWQMKQLTQKTLAGIEYDPDVTYVDGLGGQVQWLAPVTDLSPDQVAAVYGTQAAV
jgi:hypothetical protein